VALRSFFIALAGHDALSLRGESRETTQPIAMVGCTVFLAASATAANWAMAGFSLAGGGTNPSAFICAVAGASFGFLLVSTIDRAGVYQMDTQANGLFKKAALLTVRMAVVLLISAVTATAIAPYLLSPELKAHSLLMREHNDAQRASALKTRFSLDALQLSAQQAETELENARKAVETIPQEIRSHIEKAQACWRDYSNRKTRLLLQNYSEADARKLLAARANRCSADSNGARQELDTYRQRSRAALENAWHVQENARSTLSHAKATIDGRLEEAVAVEKEAITPNSAVVLESLLASDRGATKKWYGVYLLIIFLELLPLLFKVLSERTVAGVRISIDREIALTGFERLRDAAREEQNREKTVCHAMDAAMKEALSSPEVHQQAMRLFASKLEAFLPIEIAKRLMSEIEQGAQDVRSAARRHPDYAQVLTEAWSQAMAEVTERLHRSSQRPVRRAA